jgi:hypothetical protein
MSAERVRGVKGETVEEMIEEISLRPESDRDE